MKYAVLGADGQIGRLLVRELVSRDHNIVAISRKWNGEPFGKTVEYRVADAMRPEQLDEVLDGCPTVYSILGLPYVTALYESQWTPMTKNILDASLRHRARLIYFDNVYAYGLVRGWMTEDSPYRPVSRKGKVRAQAAQLLLDAIAERDARIIIARSADFVGPGADLSAVGSRLFGGVVGKTSARRRVEWLGYPRTRHCYNGTLDIAAALVMLGETGDTEYGQTWHLPTYGPMTGFEFCAALGKVCNCTVSPRPLTGWMLRVAGMFNPLAREQIEMLYQFTNDYLFSDEKFRARFPTFEQKSFSEVLARTVEYFAGRQPTTRGAPSPHGN